MLNEKQLQTPAHAREWLKLTDGDWTAILKHDGGVDSPEKLTGRGYDRVCDRLYVLGYTSPAFVGLVSAAYVAILRRWKAMLGVSEQTYRAVVKIANAGELNEEALSGEALNRLIMFFGELNAPLQELARRELSQKQLRLLHAARRELNLSDGDMNYIALNYGGVQLVEDLDQRGFDRVVMFFEKLGFRLDRAAKRHFSERPGMATPEQLDLLQGLWRDYAGSFDEAQLNGWLERSYRISTLRFLTAGTASKAINGLRAMIARRASAPRQRKTR